jgi:precorrin-2/cobalt-factor-2 C20-methyltransferase
MNLGTLYGIGAGPGDPELMTVKGLILLQKVPVVAFPAGIGGKLGIAQQIVTQWLNSQQLQLPLNFPYIQDEAVLIQAWKVAAQEVWVYIQQGKDVAFVSEGDVSFYSTFSYLAQTLQELYPEVRVETIPGICSPLAAAAVLGMPLTIRGQRLAILPALYHVTELETALDASDVVVLMKVSSVYEEVWALLERRGLLDTAYLVERATLPEQVVYYGLRDRSQLQLPYFSIMIIQVNG